MPTSEPIVHDDPSAPVLFVADLHLEGARPAMIEAFERFCSGPARSAQAVYVLGDLFEAWIGDDDDDPELARVLEALAALTDGGVPAWFMAGNRDFLVGERFFATTGLQPLGDEQLIDLFGVSTLLCHGDTLCTDDVDYQRFRAQVREREWLDAFLDKPLAERRRMAQALRGDSRTAMAGKGVAIMDVNENAVHEALSRTGAARLVHGHTHRPARHTHRVDGRKAERWVLDDWYERPSMLVATATNIENQYI